MLTRGMRSILMSDILAALPGSFWTMMCEQLGDDAIRARNLARSLVLGAFESISVRCLPFPGLHGGDAALTRLSGGFVRQYQALQAHLVDLS